VAVAAAVGQLKWDWFYRSNGRLYDLQIFDDGSRGPLGAALLAGFVHVRSLATLGAIVTVCSIAIDPFAQQVLTFPTRIVFRNSSQAEIRQARNFTSVPDLAAGDLFTNVNLSPMIAEPLFQGVYSGRRELEATCATGNCSWPSFYSLSWRTKCLDKTSSVSLEGCDFSFGPDDPVNAISRQCSLSTGTNDPWTLFMTRTPFGNDTIRIKGPQYIIWPTVDFNWADISDYAADGTVPNAANNFMSMAQVELGYNDTEINEGIFTAPHVISATECSLVPCVQEYSISVSGGRLAARILSTTYGTLPETSALWSASVPSSSLNFTISLEVLYAIASGIFYLLQGNATRIILDNTTHPSTNSFTITPGTTYGNRDVSPDSLAYVLQYRGFESTMHDIASQLTYLTFAASDISISGSMGIVESLVHVRWRWLALPIAVVCLGVAFLVATIIATRRHRDLPVWKSSIVPFFFEDVDGARTTRVGRTGVPDTGVTNPSMRTLSMLEDRAKGIR
jgi:hypothetical protein